MRVFPVLFVLYFAATIQAGAIRGAWERIWLYYVYRMEADQYGVGETYLANECRGQNSPVCNFNEFIKYINSLDKLPDLGLPDGLKTANKMADTKTKNLYVPDLDPSKFMPLGTNDKSGYSGIMKRAGLAMEALFEVQGDKIKSSPYWALAEKSAFNVKQCRARDYQKYRTAAVEAELKKRPELLRVKWEEVGETTFGKKWKWIDLDATAKSDNNKNVPDLQKTLSDWETKYQQRPPPSPKKEDQRKGPKGHWAALDRAGKSWDATRTGHYVSAGVEVPYQGC